MSYLAETERTIEVANSLSKKDKKICALYIAKKIGHIIRELENKPAPSREVDSIIKRQMAEATKLRQEAAANGGYDSEGVFHNDDNNPDWIKTALVEGLVAANSGTLGQDGEEIFNITMNWVNKFVSEKEKEEIMSAPLKERIVKKSNFKEKIQEGKSYLFIDSVLRNLKAFNFNKRKVILKEELDYFPMTLAEAHATNFDSEWLDKVISKDKEYFKKISFYDFNKIVLEKFIEINKKKFNIFSKKITKFEDFFVDDEKQDIAFGLCQINILIMCQALEKNEELKNKMFLKRGMLIGWTKI